MSRQLAPPRIDPGIPTAAFWYTASGWDLPCPSSSRLWLQSKIESKTQLSWIQIDLIPSCKSNKNKSPKHSYGLKQKCRRKLERKENPIDLRRLNRSSNWNCGSGMGQMKDLGCWRSWKLWENIGMCGQNQNGINWKCRITCLLFSPMADFQNMLYTDQIVSLSVLSFFFI